MSIFGLVRDTLSAWFNDHPREYQLFYSVFNQLGHKVADPSHATEPSLFLEYLLDTSQERQIFVEVALLVPVLVPLDSWVLECLWDETSFLLSQPETEAPSSQNINEWITTIQKTVQFPGVNTIKAKYPPQVTAQLAAFNQIGLLDKVLDVPIPSYSELTNE